MFEYSQELFSYLFGVTPVVRIYEYHLSHMSSLFLLFNKLFIETAGKKEKLPLRLKHLHNSKIPYYDVATSTGKTTGVNLTTYHNVKGLEFKIVFITGINSETLPLRPVAYETWDKVQQVEFDTMERSLLYVAMTRAMQQLIIT